MLIKAAVLRAGCDSAGAELLVAKIGVLITDKAVEAAPVDVLGRVRMVR
jgi:hypothetical protein